VVCAGNTWGITAQLKWIVEMLFQLIFLFKPLSVLCDKLRALLRHCYVCAARSPQTRCHGHYLHVGTCWPSLCKLSRPPHCRPTPLMLAACKTSRRFCDSSIQSDYWPMGHDPPRWVTKSRHGKTKITIFATIYIILMRNNNAHFLIMKSLLVTKVWLLHYSFGIYTTD